MVKNPSADAGDARVVGSIPGSRRMPGRGHGNPVQYSCRENPVDSGAWWATVYKVAKSQTWLKQLSTHRHTRPTSKYIMSTWFRATIMMHTQGPTGTWWALLFVITLPLTLLSWSASPHLWRNETHSPTPLFPFNVLFPPQKLQYFASYIIII